MKNLYSLILFFLASIIIANAQNTCNPILTNGLVAYYPFCGNANDASGNGYNGTINGGVTLTTDRFGNPNSAYDLDGTTGYIDCGNISASIDFSNGISFCAWIKVSLDTNSSVVDKMGDGTSGQGFRINVRASTFGQDFYANSGTYLSGISAKSTSLYTLNNWYFIIGTWGTDDSLRIYYNGQKQQTVYSPYNYSNTQSIYIGRGRLSSTYEFFGGIIDDISIYNRALADNEVANLYNTNLCVQTITVTDTLIINANITGFNPVTWNNSIKIYPNPTDDHITIDNGTNYNTMTGYTIRIDNPLAQPVFTTVITQQLYSINLNTWSGKGVYFVFLIDNAAHTIDVRKIVLQ